MNAKEKLSKISSKIKEGISLRTGDSVSIEDLSNKLSHLGYTNVTPGNVAKVGEFTKRGGVVDIWLERYKLPVRLDLIGEEIESIYLFNTLTQDKSKILKQAYIVAYGITPLFPPKWTKKRSFPVESDKYERLFLSEIQPGDLVVHIDYGIGRFVEIGGSEPTDQQFLVVAYAGGDKLFVPVEQIERLTKYVGVGGRKPTLSKLGTAGWERTKQKVQEDVAEYAAELLQLYARRQIASRPSLSLDSSWQRQMEESFEFKETHDQLAAVRKIKQDLESAQPMDRLLVGDVGFGKTEVAIRAAFKVVQEGKQVAVLVPTTILADQHYFLFRDRLKQFPVESALLSRFKSELEQKKTVEELKGGKTDIVIGTHRLLSKDVSFKNLGLIIIDEEHRFGVRHKEWLKSLRPSIDVLSMSATPIPRSLQMSIAKLRDMSILQQAPVGRKPIETLIDEHDKEKVKEAIEKEIDRGGQVYYVFNDVEKIATKAHEVATLAPNGKVVYAHGQMKGRELEKVMEQFYSKKADILVCTTIIGSGIDMPNVNTIIIEGAHRFGLADLYQLRGRIGRSERQAYAYLFYPKKYVPEGQALERLSSISQATGLGSGFKIARQDLEIRGAGNLLGTAQHGNVALVGFELYVQLLAQAVEKIKNKSAPQL
jgi:transcription-repair coupling factor (superfamily II helicase)